MAVVWDPILEQALADGRTLTWRTERVLRWGTVVGAAVAVVVALFGWWRSATDPSPHLGAEHLSDGEVILLGGAWCALVLAGSAVWAWCRQVTVAPEGLVVRRVVSVTTMAWPSIGAVETDRGSVLVSSAEGTFLVPLGQWGPASIAGAGAGAAAVAPAAAIEVAWWRRRGQAWSPPPLDAWVPTYDRRGRVVLRRSLGELSAIHGSWLASFVGAFSAAAVRRWEEPIVVGSYVFVSVGLVVAVLATVRLRTGVVIDGDDVVVQRFRHTDRWCRRDVVGISTTSQRWPLNAPRHHLVLVLRDGRGILLPAPTTSTTSASTNDPAFERKRRWFVEHLVLPNLDATERAASTAAAVLPPPPSLASNPPPPAPPHDPDAWSGPGPLGA